MGKEENLEAGAENDLQNPTFHFLVMLLYHGQIVFISLNSVSTLRGP